MVVAKEIDERVASIAVIDAVESKLLHEAVLQGLVRALDTSFGGGLARLPIDE